MTAENPPRPGPTTHPCFLGGVCGDDPHDRCRDCPFGGLPAAPSDGDDEPASQESVRTDGSVEVVDVGSRTITVYPPESERVAWLRKIADWTIGAWREWETMLEPKPVFEFWMRDRIANWPVPATPSREAGAFIDFAVKCPNYDEAGQHNAVRLRVRTVGTLLGFLAAIPGCDCGSPLASFVPFVSEEP